MGVAHDEILPVDPHAPVSLELVRVASDALAADNRSQLRSLVAELRAPDIADLLELLSPEQRVQLVVALDHAFDPDVFSKLSEPVRDQLAKALPNDLLATVVEALRSDDAAHLIESLAENDRREILGRLPPEARAAIERNLTYPEDSAGRLMQGEFVAIAPFWTAGRVVDHLRESEDLPETFEEIFVVDPGYHVLGSINLSRLLKAGRETPVSAFMDGDRHLVRASADRKRVALEFERYGLLSAPVVDDSGRLIGIITVDDVIEVAREEAESDLRALSGVAGEHISDSVGEVVVPRFWWLFLNLGTSVLASTVIKVFDNAIQNLIALAVLMPIVAAVGCHAGLQTTTVAVRGLALRELSTANFTRFIIREATVGLLNGLALSVVLSAIVIYWFGSIRLGVVIGTSMIITVTTATVAGTLIPGILERMRLDPAVTGAPLVTAVASIVGFLSFLGLSSLWLV